MSTVVPASSGLGSNSSVASEVDNMRTFTQYDWYKAAYYLGMSYPWLVCAVGLPCNIANVIVIWRKWMMSPPTLYIAVLSIIDSIALSHKLLVVHLPTLGVYMSAGGCRYLEFIGQTATQLSSWTLVLLSAERAMVIKFPFSRRTICSIRRTLITLTATTVILAVLNSHWLFTVTSFETRPECKHHQDFRQFITNIWYYIEATSFAFLPFLCLIISNSVIMACMYSRIKREQARCQYSRLNQNGSMNRCEKGGGASSSIDTSQISISTSSSGNNSLHVSPRNTQQSPAGLVMSQQYRKITRSTLFASLVFFILTVPYCVVMITFKYVPVTRLTRAHAKLIFLTTVVYALRDFSHAVNFFVYALPTSSMLKCRVFLSRSHRYTRNTAHHTASFKLVSGKESFSMKMSSSGEPSRL